MRAVFGTLLGFLALEVETAALLFDVDEETMRSWMTDDALVPQEVVAHACAIYAELERIVSEDLSAASTGDEKTVIVPEAVLTADPQALLAKATIFSAAVLEQVARLEDEQTCRVVLRDEAGVEIGPSLADLGRLLGIQPEDSARKTNDESDPGLAVCLRLMKKPPSLLAIQDFGEAWVRLKDWAMDISGDVEFELDELRSNVEVVELHLESIRRTLFLDLLPAAACFR